MDESGVCRAAWIDLNSSLNLDLGIPKQEDKEQFQNSPTTIPSPKNKNKQLAFSTTSYGGANMYSFAIRYYRKYECTLFLQIDIRNFKKYTHIQKSKSDPATNLHKNLHSKQHLLLTNTNLSR